MKDHRLEIGALTADEYIELAQSVGWKLGKCPNLTQIRQALLLTPFIVVIRDSSGKAIAAGRVFSDDLTMTFIPDLWVRPEFQGSGVGRRIVEKIKERYGHTIFYFGAQLGNEPFFEKLGFKKGMTSFTGRF